jgi:hypothetical protein
VIAAEQALRDWANSKTGLVGPGNPLAGGALLRLQRSPADGAYARIIRHGGSSDTVAEQDANLCTASITWQVYSATEDVAERAAAALATEIEQLTGSPEPCGPPGQATVTVLVSDNLAGPVYLPPPPESGELGCFQVTADFLLAAL